MRASAKASHRKFLSFSLSILDLETLTPERQALQRNDLLARGSWSNIRYSKTQYPRTELSGQISSRQYRQWVYFQAPQTYLLQAFSTKRSTLIRPWRMCFLRDSISTTHCRLTRAMLVRIIRQDRYGDRDWGRARFTSDLTKGTVQKCKH